MTNKLIGNGFKYGVLLAVLTFSLSASGATLSYNGYSRDTDSNIVIGGGLEWLQWTATLGLSVNTALSTYSANGWRIASHNEVSILLNSFHFGEVFDEDPTTAQLIILNDSEYSIGPANHFINIFGDTYQAAGLVYDYGDKREISNAFFGESYGFQTLVGNIEVRDEYTSNGGGGVLDGRVLMSSADYDQSEEYRFSGVALVRDFSTVSPVPLPAAGWLFISGLLGLLGVKRRIGKPLDS